MSDSTLLAADVGATNTRLRLSTLSAGSGVKTLAEATVRSGDAKEIKAGISRFARQHLATSSIQAAVLGLPGKISSDRQSCAISYLDPSCYISFKDLFDDLRVEAGALLNDLECGVQGIPEAADPRLEILCGSRGESEGWGNGLVLGMPGSGLGIGLTIGLSGSVPSEGGHIPAAIDSNDELERLIGSAILGLRPGGGESNIPTYEGLLRGGALPVIFLTIVERRSGATALESAAQDLKALPTGEQPRAIASWASSEESSWHTHALETFNLYGRFFGRLMQSLALSFLPAAVCLGGGIVLATHSFFAESFVECFQRHPVHADFLQSLPAFVVRNPTLNLDGATRSAADLALGRT